MKCFSVPSSLFASGSGYNITTKISRLSKLLTQLENGDHSLINVNIGDVIINYENLKEELFIKTKEWLKKEIESDFVVAQKLGIKEIK
jgi:hypothetical protein